MQRTKAKIFQIARAVLWILILNSSCDCRNPESPEYERNDSAVQLPIPLDGSLQNPAWSPDGKSIVFTRFRKGYNRGPADLAVYDLESGTVRILVSDGSDNVNLPGSAWSSSTNKIVFSSSREPHDEIFLIDASGNPGDETKITERVHQVAYEPSLSEDGQWIVFESHEEDVEEDGIITKYKIDGSQPYQSLTTAGEDCRQPNWSPAGQKLVYQKFTGGQWEIWTMNEDGTDPCPTTGGPGDKTDASFSPDGEWIVFSADGPALKYANLFIISVSGGERIQLSYSSGYDGAPSWSPDGEQIAFESSPSDPETRSGTRLWVLDSGIRASRTSRLRTRL